MVKFIIYKTTSIFWYNHIRFYDYYWNLWAFLYLLPEIPFWGKNESSVKQFHSLKLMKFHFSGWLVRCHVAYLKVITIVFSRFRNNWNDCIIGMLQYNELEVPRRFRIYIKRLWLVFLELGGKSICIEVYYTVETRLNKFKMQSL